MKNFFHKKSGNIKYAITDSNIEKELSVNLTEGFFLKKKVDINQSTIFHPGLSIILFVSNIRYQELGRQFLAFLCV